MLSLNVANLGFSTMPMEANPCEGTKPSSFLFSDLVPQSGDTSTTPYFDNVECAGMIDVGYNVALPQAGMDVTADMDYGVIDTESLGLFPIMEEYHDTDLCPVNVHWHLGSEHRSEGQYDENGYGPHSYESHGARRELAEGVRQGMLCHHYDAADPVYTTPYDWKYCVGMEVGQTYEVHWPHSAAGECGTKFQYQTPFYDGVFCKVSEGILSINLLDGDSVATGTDMGYPASFNVHQKVGVQGQVFTIVNDDYDPTIQNDDLIYGAWMDDTHWVDVARYLGSTTGTSRDNEICSMYTPITWQVDRTCHKISARSFDMMCKAMMEVGEAGGDDMSDDLHAHGSRELVNDEWTTDVVYRKKD